MSIATENKGAEGITAQVNPDFAKEIQSLKDSLAKLSADVSELVSHAADAGKNIAHVARNRAGGVVKGVQQRVGDLKQQGAHYAEALEERIADRPLASGLILFGVGFMVATFFSRK